MLTKLLKHEFIATSRIFGMAYAAVLAMGLLAMISGFLIRDNVDSTFGAMFVAAGVFIYGMVIVGAAIITVFVLLQRFYQNLLGREGYLMFTLPVKRSELIFSKLIAGVAWQFICAIVIIVSLALTAIGWGGASMLQDLFTHGIPALLRSIADMGAIPASLMVLGIPVVAASSLLLYYLAMSLGQLASKNRILWSVVAWFGITSALQMLISMGLVLVVTVGGTLELHTMEGSGILNLFSIGLFGWYLIQCSAYFLGTKFLLEKKLNLA
jgi:hypothetical protein